MIGDGVEIRVVRIGRDEVRLGIIAPPDIAVHRREVYEEIRRENQAANAVLEGRAGAANRPHRRTNA